VRISRAEIYTPVPIGPASFAGDGGLMRTFTLTTPIATDPERVWATAAAFERYPTWNPVVHRLKVETTWSTRLKMVLRMSRTVRLSGSLIEHDRPRLIKWNAGHPVWGLLRVRYELLISLRKGASDVTQTVRVSGLLPRLAPHTLSSLPDVLAETAHALRREVERAPAPALAA
jgi:uncharacterized protein YndB with AHSA1/START domain